MRLPLSVLLIVVVSGFTTPIATAQTHNYSEAFQKALFFYETQTSGALPLDHRVEWRGPSATRDGSDVGRDLTGGWYDAGDGVVWTGNDCFGASMLAWSLTKHRAVYISTGQYQIAIDRLREITAYLEKITQLDGSGNVDRLYCGKGSITNNPPDDPAVGNDRTNGIVNELMDTVVGGAPQALRPSYWVDSVTGGADVAGAIAGAFASASIAFRDYGDIARADQLLTLAKKVYAWGEANPNLASVTNHNGAIITTSVATRRLTNGAIVTLPGYPTRVPTYTPRMLYAAAWLHRADRSAATAGYTTGWVDKAVTIYNSTAHATQRSKPWVNFASGAEQNGAYAMLAADSGRAVFVTEANAYARFWANDRFATTGRTTDITTSPDGFLSRFQNGSWNIHYLLDQAPPLLDWADSTNITDTTLKANLISLYTGTYAKCPVKQLDYILGSNSRKLSYLVGYKPAGTGYDWVRNIHYRATWFQYGGFGTPSSDKPAWNTAIAYGTLTPGPDHTDFYPQTKPLTDGTSIGFQEPIIYTGGLLTVLARNIALGGSSAGSVLGTFPAWENRAADYQTTSFFVRASKDSATRLQCSLNNRASLPPREINTLGFRYYFTPPSGVAGSAVTCTAAGIGLLAGESVSVSGPTQVGATTTWYFAIQFNNAMIVPGEFSRYRRKVQLDFSHDITTAGHSGTAIATTEATIANIPVYDTSGGAGAWKLLGGFEPSAGYIQWRRAHFNNSMESAGNAVLVAERVGGSSGAVSATIACNHGTATAADYTAPAGAAAIISWAGGETGEKTISIPLTADSYKEGREYFNVVLGTFTGGAAAGITTTARVSIEDDDFDGTPDPGSLIQVFGNNTPIATGDTTPAISDDTDFGNVTTSFDTATRTFTIQNVDSSALTLTGSPRVALSGTNAADFSVVALPASSVAASSATTFQIRFAPSINGPRTATVTIPNNKSTSGSFTFAIQGTGTGANPVGSVSPSAVTKELKPGGGTPGTATQTITLSNTGRANLPWTASLPTNYVAKSSTASGGVPYEWIDITTAGPNQGATLFNLSSSDQDDELSAATSIGFNFPYYGANKTQLKVSTNGWVTFDTASNSTVYTNAGLPSSSFPSHAIAVWWDDLKLYRANPGANVYYKRVDADTFVVTWNDIGYYNNSSAKMSFQLILKRNGLVICQYQDVLNSPDPSGYTIGLQNANAAAQAVSYAYNSKTAENGIAIGFLPPPRGSYDVTGTTSDWATLAPASGTANAQSSSTFNLSLNTTGLISGQSYPTEITLLTPADTTNPSFTLPATLTVKQSFNLATAGTSDRTWETTSNWAAPTAAFPGPSDDLTLTTAGGSLRIDGPRTIASLTLNASAGLTLTGTGFGGAGTGATLTTQGLVTVQQGALLVGGSTAKLLLNGGLTLSGGSFGFATGSIGSITVANGAPITLSGGVLDTLINTSGTLYRQALGTGDLTLAGAAPEIKVSEDVFTLPRRLTGSGGFKKSGSGILVLTGSSADHTGTTELAAGTLRLGAANVLGGDSSLKLSGGTLAVNGETITVGTLQLAATSTIDFTGGGTLVFSDSSAIAWAGTTLALSNFDPATSVLRFGNSTTGLTSAQLAKITLNGAPFPLTSLNSSGFLDNAAPTWTSGWPQADSPTGTGFTVRARTSETGTTYYVVLPSGAAAPTATQVKAGQNATGTAAPVSGNIPLTANAESSALLTGLASNTPYDVYFIAQDDVPNVQSAPVKVTITTATGPSYTWTTDTSGNWNDTTKWTPAGVVPNERDITVTFGPVATASRTVTLTTHATVGHLVFNEDTVTANSYTIALNTGQSLTFDVTTGTASLNARGLGGYALGTQGSGQIILADTLAISAGASGAATSDSGTVVINSQLTGSGGLILSSLNSNDGTGTSVSGSRGTTLRSTTANTFSGGVTVHSGFVSIAGHIGNLGSGPLTLNSSDGTNGGIGTNFFIKTGGGTIANAIAFGNPITTGAPQLAFVIGDAAASTYTFTGALTGTVANLSPRFNNSVTAANASTWIFNGDGSGLTTTSTQWAIRTGKVQLGHAHALGSGNGNGTHGRYTLGNWSNGSNGVAALLSNGFNVGGNIAMTSTNTASQTSGDNIILGGVHTSGSATFSGTIQIARIVGGTRQLQLTSALGGATDFSGVISDTATSGSASTLVPIYKTGAGTVSLTAANTYGGGTTVAAGTLFANNPSGSATGTGAVSVASGATLGGTGTIAGPVTLATGGKLAFVLSTLAVSHDKLDLNSSLALGTSGTLSITATAAAAPGTYTLVTAAGGITGSLPVLSLPVNWSASLQISGNNLNLVVSSVGSALATFRTSYGLAANGSQDLFTPAGDGVQNLLKYAFNMLGSGVGQASTLTTPNAAILDANGSAGLPFVALGTGPNAGKLQITYIRRKAASTPGITYAVEFSDALASWAVNPSATEGTPGSIDATFERVTVTDSIYSPYKRFVRVRISAP